jgi:tetratricopeptide (TPR) repeat protein
MSQIYISWGNFGIIITIIGTIVTIVAIFVGVPGIFSYLKEKRKERERLKNYFGVIWKNSRKLKPDELMGDRGRNYFHEDVYLHRKEDDLVSQALGQKKNVLIIGPPLSGKSRLIYQVFKKSKKSYYVIVPRAANFNPDTYIFPRKRRFWRSKIIVLDDLHRFVQQPNFEILWNSIPRDILVIASTWSEGELTRVKSAMNAKGLHFDIKFDNVISIPTVSEDTAKKVAREAKITWEKVRFDGNIGSVFLPLTEMEERFKKCTNEQRHILESIKDLYEYGIFREDQIFPVQWIKKAASLRGLTGSEEDWVEWIQQLKALEFLKIHNDSAQLEEVYLQDIIDPLIKRPIFGFIKDIIEIFTDQPEALLNLGFHSYGRGLVETRKADYMKIAIEAHSEALKVYSLDRYPENYARTQNNIGISYRTLADGEDKAKNCYKAIEAFNEALKVRTLERYPMNYAMTQNNLGTAYTTLAEVEQKAKNCQRAIEAYSESLKVYTFDRFPMEYAMTQHNIGTTYGILASLKVKAGNCQRATIAFNEALKVYTPDRFPIDYAMTQNNLGNTYRILAEVEDKAENCRKAISAYNEALKVNTPDRFPLDYAMTQNNLGTTYRILSGVGDKPENCRKAVEAFEKSLKVITLDCFPMQFAAIQNNLGNAYGNLAEVEETANNCTKAITAYKEALRIYTIDRLPMQYAMTQNNLGTAYQTLTDVEGKAENCRKAIVAFNEAMKISTLDRFPLDYAMIQNNVGVVYQTLAEVENKAENCRKAIVAFNEALKIRTLDRFPIEYAMTQNNLGNAYERLADVEERTMNLQRAVSAFNESLQAIINENLPDLQLTILINLEKAKILATNENSE